MIKFVLPLALVAVATPALADTVKHVAFQRDGTDFVADVTDFTNGERLIAGHEVGSGRAFTLRVVRGKVTGYYDRSRVSYDAPKAKAIVTASR